MIDFKSQVINVFSDGVKLCQLQVSMQNVCQALFILVNYRLRITVRQMIMKKISQYLEMYKIIDIVPNVLSIFFAIFMYPFFYITDKTDVSGEKVIL